MGKKTQQQRKKKLKYTGKFNCGTFKGAAEQKARATYEKLIDLCRDYPDVLDPLKFLREREIVHFQRFGEALRGVQDRLAEKKFYMNSNNPIFVNNSNMNTNMMNNQNMMNTNNNSCGCGR